MGWLRVKKGKEGKRNDWDEYMSDDKSENVDQMGNGLWTTQPR